MFKGFLAEIFVKLKKYEKAINIYTELIETESMRGEKPNITFYIKRAYTYLCINNFDLAMHDFETFKKEREKYSKEPNYSSLSCDFFTIALDFKVNENFETAIKIFDICEELYKDDWLLYDTRYECYEELGNYKKALGDYKKYMELYKEYDYGYKYSKLGELYFKNQEYEKAIENYQKAIELDKKNNEDKKTICYHYTDLAEAYIKMKKYDEAEEVFEKIYSSNPDKDETIGYINMCKEELYTDKGNYYLENKDYESAITTFEKLVECCDTYNEWCAYIGIARAYRGMQLYDNAIKYYTKAYESEDYEPIILQERAEIFEILNKTNLAEKDRIKAKEIEEFNKNYNSDEDDDVGNDED